MTKNKKKKKKKKNTLDDSQLMAVVIISFFLVMIIASPIFSVCQGIFKQANAVSASEQIKPAVTTASDPSIDYVRLKNFHQSIPILMFHHIRDYVNPKDPINTNLSTPVADFKGEMAALKDNGYSTISFKSLLDGDIPKKSVILTFDDGYNDNFENAYPILKANNQVGTFFIISKFVNTSGFMTTDQLKAMARNGMEIGSHTESHLDLTTLSNEELLYQIDKSKTDLEKTLDLPIVAFCYPSGKLNPTVESVVKNSGYNFAVTEGYKVQSNDLYQMPRIRMNPWDSSYDIIFKIDSFLTVNSDISWNY